MNFEDIEKAYKSITDKIPYKPVIGVIIGSGLGDFVDTLSADAIINYNGIANFPVSTVDGHKGRFVFSQVSGVPVVFMQGRVHYYEGYTMEEVVMPVRLMRLMGVEKLFVTNAAGGINPLFKAGTFMVIKDHIMLSPNPLIGKNYVGFGTRFPDMSEAYDKRLIAVINTAGIESGIRLEQGVYIQLTGPSFETPAEIRMCAKLGADAVGMSTACEVVAANHAGMRVCGVSIISNAAAGISDRKLSHEEVKETSAKICDKFAVFMQKAILRISSN